MLDWNVVCVVQGDIDTRQRCDAVFTKSGSMASNPTALANAGIERRDRRKSAGNATNAVRVETDIDVTGRPNAERLTVEGEMLCVESTVSRQSRRWPLNLVADFRLDDSIGSCFLQARYDGRWIDILRIRGRGGDGLRTVLGKLKGRVFQRESAGVVPKATENGPQERLPEGAAAPGALPGPAAGDCHALAISRQCCGAFRLVVWCGCH